MLPVPEPERDPFPAMELQSSRVVSVYSESALVFVSDAFSTVNRIHFT
jgi:hypothetical protein